MDAVAQPPARAVARDRDGSHDLADPAAAAEQKASAGHPGADARLGRMELERTRIDGRGLRPVGRTFGGDDIQEVDPPGRALDEVPAAVTTDGDVVLDDRPDRDPHQLHGPSVAEGGLGTPRTAGPPMRAGASW